MRSILRPALLVLATFVMPATGFAEDQLRTISVSGEGEVKIAPDMAIVSVGVEFDALSANEAMDMASQATSAILLELVALKIDAKDIQSGSIRLSPRYAQNLLGGIDFSKIEGYVAANEVTVKVRDLNELGALLSSVIGKGANRLNGVSFALQDPNEATDQARIQAVTEAHRRAMLYAQAAGVTLGDLMQLSDTGYAQAPMFRVEPMIEMSSGASDPQYDVPVAPGELTIAASVSVVYEIQN